MPDDLVGEHLTSGTRELELLTVLSALELDLANHHQSKRVAI
jgi:hypothetical protein